MKGVELPINILVIVAIAVIVLLGLIALYFVGWSPFPRTAGLEAVKNNACAQIVQQGCDDDPAGIPVSYDVDNSGEVGDTGDTLQALCEVHYGVASGDAIACRRICGCV